ncbi:hypothetical protein [Marinobacterium jannaschii]
MSNLSQTEFAEIKQRCLENGQAAGFLQQDELSAVAARLAEQISLPYLSEAAERRVIHQVALQIDQAIASQLPLELLELIHQPDQGLDDDEAALLHMRLERACRAQLQFCYLSEVLEQYAVRFTLTVFVNAMREGSFFQHAVQQTNTSFITPDFPFPALD